MAESPPSGVIPAIELIVHGTIARNIPIVLRGRFGDGGLQELSGIVSVEPPLGLRSFFEDLGSAFGEAVGTLDRLLGESADISLRRVGVGYAASQHQKFAQVSVTMDVGTAAACDFVIVKCLAPGGYIAGLQARTNRTRLETNPLRGLIGDVSIGGLGIYYASAPFKDLPFYSGDAFQDGKALALEPPGAPRRDFAQGISFSGEILVGDTNLLDGLGTAGTPSSTAPPPPTPPAGPPPLAKSTTWFEVDKTIGPVSIRRVGLALDGGFVGIRLDAGLRLSVLSLSLAGLGLSVPLQQLTRNPLNAWKCLQFNLDGAAVAFQEGPLTISGGLLKVKDDPLQMDGALLIRTEMLTISAVGSYTNLGGAPSVFVFAALQKELGGPPFFFVTGLAVGFGVNRALTLPSIDEVQDFPLIKAAIDRDYLGTDMDLRRVSQALDAYIAPAPGRFWIAAGVRFTSFGMVDSFALLSVSFGTQFEIALLGLSRVVIPRQLPGAAPVPVIACAELAIKVVVAPASGLLACEARLTDNSFVLRRDFKLRGGFAFYSWFGGEHEGDFVISIGGYHPKFLPPAHYPRPDPVQFTCRIGDVTIQGQCYFALCPSAIMAGGKLSIVYESGGVRAWLIAHADFLLRWKPIYYDVTIGVAIGVALHLTAGIIRVSLSAEVSASLALHGPPLGGTARISLSVVSVTVRFGEDTRKPPALLWESDEPDHPEKSFAKSFLPNPKVTTVTVTDGVLEEIRKGEETVPQIVPHTLVVACRTLVPVTEVRLNGKPPTDGTGKPLVLPTLTVNGRPTTLGVASMGKTTMHSRLEVTIEPIDASGDAGTSLEQYVEVSLIAGRVPLAMWGQPNALAAPPRDHLIDGALLGLEIRTKPGPRLWEIPALDLEILAHDHDEKRFAFTTTTSREALTAFGEKTISTTIADAGVVALRTGILEVIARDMARDIARTRRRIIAPDDVRVEQLQANAPYIFQAMPAMARAGQYPPGGGPQS